jgi:hypothetical protein
MSVPVSFLTELCVFTSSHRKSEELLQFLVTLDKTATSAGYSPARGPEVQFRVWGSRKGLLLQGSSELTFHSGRQR